MRKILLAIACGVAAANTSPLSAAVTTTEPAPGAETRENGFDLAILSGKKPAVAFYDQQQGGLFFTHASWNSTSQDTINWGSRWLLDSPVAGNDTSPHLYMSQAFREPVYAGISYYDGDSKNIRFVAGQSPDNGTSWSWTAPTDVSLGAIAWGDNDLTMVKPWYAKDTTFVVSYFDESGTIAVAGGIQSSQGNSTIWSQPESLSATAGAGQYLSVTSMNTAMDAVVGVAYYDENSENLKYIAGNMSLNGTSGGGNGITLYDSINWSSPVTIDSNGAVGKQCDIITTSAEKYPVVAYYDAGNTALKFAAAESSNGSSWLEPERVVDTAAEISSISLAATGYRQVGITYYDSGLKNMMYVTGEPGSVASANGTSWGNDTLWSKPVVVTTEQHSIAAVLGSRTNAQWQSIPGVAHMDSSYNLYYTESVGSVFSGINSTVGDVNGDGFMDLKDAIIPLQVVAGAQPGPLIDLASDLVAKVDITIDGNMNDWAGVPYLIEDPVGDNSGTVSGADINSVYFARNDEYLFVAFRLADGIPNTANYYQTNLYHDPYNYLLNDISIRYNAGTSQWVTEFRDDLDYDDSLETTLFVDLAAAGDGFVEGRVPLSAIPFSVSWGLKFNSKIYSQGITDSTTTVTHSGISSLPYRVGNGKIGLEESLNALKTSGRSD